MEPAQERIAVRRFGVGMVAYLVLMGVALVNAPLTLTGIWWLRSTTSWTR